MATATAERPRTQQPSLKEAPAGNLPATQSGERPKPPLAQFQEYMSNRTEQLQFALPSHISPDRFTRIVLTALQRKPDLLRCTKQSLWNACLLAAQDGLLPDGREGAIVPYGENADGKKKADIATWMPMIEGLRKKARNSGEISDWLAFTVRARDAFKVVLGDAPRIDHEPYMGPDDPGDIVAAYSIAWLKDGTISRDVMTIRDLMKIRAKSKATNGPWNDPTFFGEMCKKTVARRHYKQLPHSSDLDEMIKRDDEAFGLEDRGDDQIEQRQVRRLASVSNALDQFAGAPLTEAQPSPAEAENIDDGIGGEFEDGAARAPQQAVEQPGWARHMADLGLTQQPADAADDLSDADTDYLPEDDRQPPPEPRNAEQYVARVKMLADTFDTAEALKAWREGKGDNGYMGPAERKLRSTCGVFKDPHGDDIDAYIRDRMHKLRGQ